METWYNNSRDCNKNTRVIKCGNNDKTNTINSTNNNHNDSNIPLFVPFLLFWFMAIPGPLSLLASVLLLIILRDVVIWELGPEFSNNKKKEKKKRREEKNECDFFNGERSRGGTTNKKWNEVTERK